MSFKLDNEWNYNGLIGVIEYVIKYGREPVDPAGAFAIDFILDWTNDKRKVDYLRERVLPAYKRLLEEDYKARARENELWVPKRLSTFWLKGRHIDPESETTKIYLFIVKLHRDGKSRPEIIAALWRKDPDRYRTGNPSQDIDRAFKRYKIMK